MTTTKTTKDTKKVSWLATDPRSFVISVAFVVSLSSITAQARRFSD